MGLAGVKNRSKIGTDPNNTKWARNTGTYGQRILRQQGWEAGQYLGQKDASHAGLYTAASASHIKVVMREDNLGIGAAGPGQNTANQCTGLDIFKDLLGRLNGASEETIEEQRHMRETAKMTQYMERRWGPMRFVRGGLLIGDEIKEDEVDEASPVTATATATTTTTTTDTSPEPASSATVSETEAGSDSKEARRKAKKEKKERKAMREVKRREKREKKEKKEKEKEEKKKEKKEKGKKRKADDDNEFDGEADQLEKKSKGKKDKEKKEKKDNKRRRLEESSASDSNEADAAETPAFSKPATMVSSRHLARRRYINQKRAAVSDPDAIKQIFMIKA